MKLICDGLDLSDAVLKVSKALSTKSANPVLEGIKITASGDTLTLLATDMEITIQKTIKADVFMEGETVVVGKYFVEFAKKLENEQVELSRLDDGKLEIKYSDSLSELSTYPINSYPKIDGEVCGDCFVIKQKDLKEIIEKTIFACSIDDSRPILKGCLFEIENNFLTVVALDGFRMSVIKKDVLATNNFKVIISARSLGEISRILENDDEDIKVFFNKNLLSIESNNTALISRLIEGEFVKYNHILPTNFENVVTVGKDALYKSIERASIVAKNDKYNIVKFDIKENIMTVSAKSEVGNVNENVNINLKGKDMSIAFNGKYLSDFLRITEDEAITLNLNSPIDPCIIKSNNNDEFLYLILPVRINA